MSSQIREDLIDTEYQLVQYQCGQAILRDAQGKLELWTAYDDFAGYVISIYGIGHEFVRSLTTDEKGSLGGDSEVCNGFNRRDGTGTS